MNRKTAIRVEDLTVAYDSRLILEKVSLEVTAGQIVGFIGPNGAGKTTLFRALLGLIKPIAGRVTFFGDAGRPNLGYVPQQDRLDPLYPLTVWEVVAMGLYRDLGPWERLSRHKSKVLDALKTVRLEREYRRKFWELSHGQRQRALLARALLSRPEILFLDEPFSGLDMESTTLISQQLTRLKSEQNLTILLIHHDLPFLRGWADRVFWVDNGRVSPLT
ncbi:metal ABC transporter ATP-binding protein [Thermosulfurimonas dismutans]|uniref:Manganese ABC transporter, ATP-binding protein SitB n=1 Tax=Thermosulfurimonas dismutans TaxID=999894 RepID=A0A179D371_9BACT|nr:ABC transporter ATP-binding protein [Thermosulfurimonas dismutans]OAQ20078.1 Manganese ABC transporter, ATP-binding protein SitB [Thermosulfurimonas dismutans]